MKPDGGPTAGAPHLRPGPGRGNGTGARPGSGYPTSRHPPHGPPCGGLRSHKQQFGIEITFGDSLRQYYGRTPWMSTETCPKDSEPPRGNTIGGLPLTHTTHLYPQQCRLCIHNCRTQPARPREPSSMHHVTKKNSDSQNKRQSRTARQRRSPKPHTRCQLAKVSITSQNKLSDASETRTERRCPTKVSATRQAVAKDSGQNPADVAQRRETSKTRGRPGRQEDYRCGCLFRAAHKA